MRTKVWSVLVGTLALGCAAGNRAPDVPPKPTYTTLFDRYVAEHPQQQPSALVALDGTVSCFGGPAEQYLHRVRQPGVEIYIRLTLDATAGTYAQDMVALMPKDYSRYVLTLRSTERSTRGGFGLATEVNDHYSGSGVVTPDGEVIHVVDLDNRAGRTGRYISSLIPVAGGLKIATYGDTPEMAAVLGVTVPRSAAEFDEMFNKHVAALKSHLDRPSEFPTFASVVFATLPPIEAARCAEMFTRFPLPVRLW